MPYKIPSQPSTLTGETKGRVTGFKEVRGQYGPQIQFDLTTDRGTRFNLWMNLDSGKAVNTFMEAGILRVIGEDEFEVVPIGMQPHLKITLKNGKLVKFDPA